MKSLLILFIIIICLSCENDSDNASNDASKNSIQYQKLTFKSLNSFKLLKKMSPSPFDIDVIAETEEEKNEYINKQIPEDVKKFDQINIDITGYAFPLQLTKGLPKAIVLMSIAPNCCFGDVLQLNDLIYVEITNPQQKIRENQLVNVKGKLTIETKQLNNQASRFMYWIKADAISIEKK